MKGTILAVIPGICLLLPQATNAQGKLYISNLSQTPTGSGAIASDSWVAQTLVTGTNAGGYMLNAVQLLMGTPSGAPSGFTVSIYSKTGDPHSLRIPGDSPQSSLGSLTGLEPIASGIYTYTTPGILLSPGTFYFLVLTATTSTNTGSYLWSAAAGVLQTNRFTIDDSYFSSSNGAAWTWYPRQRTFQLGLYASATPPPNLVINRDDSGNIRLVWPDVGSYTLQQNSNVTGADWVKCVSPVTNIGGTNACSVPSLGRGSFFRLKQ